MTQFQAANTDLILFNTIGNHSYFYKNLAVTWQQAKAYGDQIGVSMYVINDTAEELSVYNSLPFRGNDGKQYWIGLYQDLTSPNYSEPSGGWKWVDNTPLTYTNWYSMEPNNAMNGEIFAQIDWDVFGIKWNDAGNSTNNNSCACDLAFPIYEFQIQSNYLWSTGETTPTINPTPTTTTTYWCDVTINGVTCRKEITINVNSTTPAPTGNDIQILCVSPAPTVTSLTATGTGIQWYDAATGGTPLVSTTSLVDGTTYYASQTINGCESTTRLAVTVNFNDPQIIASATTVCSGTAVTLTASTPATPITNNCTLPTNLQNGLVGYWPFCGNANDASGNGNNGTVNGATLTTDRFGNANSAYSFDGVNDYIIVPHNQSINFNTNNNYSISTWVKFNNLTSDSNIIEKWEADTPYPYSLRASNNRIYAYRYLSGSAPYDNSEVNGANYNGTINYNQFYNILIEFEPNLLKLYINGQLHTTSANMLPSNLVNNLANLYFGGSSPSGIPRYLNGIIDDVFIYNRILSSEEKTQLYNIGQTTYLWSTGETTPTINPTPTTTTTYWCDVTINGVTCRKEITITVNPNITPTFTQVTDICSGATLAALPTTSNNGITGTWSPALNNTATTTYTFSPSAAQCATTATMTITVNPNITPTFTQVTDICSGATLAALPTNTFSPSAAQCATTATMTITVNPLPSSPTGNAQQTFCAIDEPTVSDVVMGSTNITWYLSAAGGTPLAMNYPLIDGLILYAASYDPGNLCESSNRFQVSISVINPTLPVLEEQLQFCKELGATIASIDTNGVVMNWYDSRTETTPLPSDYLLQNGEVLYGAAFNATTNCESTERLQVEIAIVDTKLNYFNLITIDNNQNNTALKIAGIEDFPNNSIEIYNRYGELVWTGNNYDNSTIVFKGMANVSGVVSKNSYLPSGTYFFTLKYPNICQQTELKGFIHLENKK